MLSIGHGWTEQTDVYVSDTSDQCWSGASTDNIQSGFIVPPNLGWSSAVETWEHPNWWDYIEENDFEEYGADWIWESYRLSKNDKANGDIVFFTKTFELPEETEVSSATLSITVDNAYYFYLNDDWSDSFIEKDGFADGYDPSNFYYEDEDGYLYPKEESVPPDMTSWSTVEHWDVTDYVIPGTNVLQIVAINHNPPPKSHHLQLPYTRCPCSCSSHRPPQRTRHVPQWLYREVYCRRILQP